MRPIGLAVLEADLLRSAISQVLERDEPRRILDAIGLSGHAVARRLQADPLLTTVAGRHAGALYELVTRREARAEDVRQAHDPERAYYMGARPRPVPADLLSDHVGPALRALSVSGPRALWSRAADWDSGPRVLYRCALVFVVMPVALALLVLAVLAAPSIVVVAAVGAVTILALAGVAGLAQRARHRAEARARVSFPVWLEHRAASGFEARLEQTVEADADVQALRRAEATARHVAERDLVEGHVLPAALSALAELPGAQKALGSATATAPEPARALVRVRRRRSV